MLRQNVAYIVNNMNVNLYRKAKERQLNGWLEEDDLNRKFFEIKFNSYYFLSDAEIFVSKD